MTWRGRWTSCAARADRAGPRAAVRPEVATVAGRRARSARSPGGRVGAGDRLRRLDRYVLPRLARLLAPRGGNNPPDGETRDGETPDGETPGGRGRRIVLGVLAVVGCLVVLAAVHASSKRPAGDPTVGDWVRVGVTEGQPIPAYVQTA